MIMNGNKAKIYTKIKDKMYRCYFEKNFTIFEDVKSGNKIKLNKDIKWIDILNNFIF